MKSIIKIALPIALTNMIGLIAVLINIEIIGSSSPNNFYILSIFLPLNFWLISLFESLRVPASAISASFSSLGRYDEIGIQITNMLLMMIAGILIPLILIAFFPKITKCIFAIQELSDLYQFRRFSFYMLFSSIFISPFLILCAVLNGIGKQKLSMTLSLIGVLFSTSLNYLIMKCFKLGLVSWPLAISICYSILLIIVLHILYKNQINILFKNKIFNLKEVANIAKLALPVWVTYLIIALSILLFTRLLVPYGSEIVSGYGLAFRIQTIFLLPSISIGVTVGILLNKFTIQNKSVNSRLILLNGAVLCAAIGISLLVPFYFQLNHIVSLITTNVNIQNAVSHYMKFICFSYLGLSISYYYCVVLDHIAHGIQSVIFTSLILLFEIITALILLQFWSSPDAVYSAILIGNCIAGLVCIFLLIFVHKIKFLNLSKIQVN